MKIKSQQYAEILVESVRPDNLKSLAKNFWHLLQKNKQYRDLSKILKELEIISARKEGKTIATIYSEKSLNESEIKEIENKLSKMFKNSEFRIQDSVKPDTTGIIVKVEDKIIDLSIENKINQLKQILAH